MSWYKNRPEIQILSHNSNGDLRLTINGKVYNYAYVNQWQIEKLKLYLKHNNLRSAFRLINSLQMVAYPSQRPEAPPSPERIQELEMMLQMKEEEARSGQATQEEVDEIRRELRSIKEKK